MPAIGRALARRRTCCSVGLHEGIRSPHRRTATRGSAHMNMIGYALMVNALAAARHRPPQVSTTLKPSPPEIESTRPNGHLARQSGPGHCRATEWPFKADSELAGEPTGAAELSASIPPATKLAWPRGVLPGFHQPPPSWARRETASVQVKCDALHASGTTFADSGTAARPHCGRPTSRLPRRGLSTCIIRRRARHR